MEGTEISVHPHPTTKEALAYDYDAQQRPLPGGTSHIIYNLKKQQTENQFMSLTATPLCGVKKHASTNQYNHRLLRRGSNIY